MEISSNRYRISVVAALVTLTQLAVPNARAETMPVTKSDAAWVQNESTSHDAMEVWSDEIMQNEDSITCDACGSGQCECYGVDTDPGFPSKPRRTLPGDRNRGDCPPLRYRIDQDKRSGHADAVAPWATCARPQTRYGRYRAWFVGGGAAFSNLPSLAKPIFTRGRERHANGCGQDGEGTWGLDYDGLGGFSKVWLKYTAHRHQGGEGRYQTDGEPKLIAKIKKVLHH